MKVMAFIDDCGHMNVVDISTPKKARAYICKCMDRLRYVYESKIKEAEKVFESLGYDEVSVNQLPPGLIAEGKAKLSEIEREIAFAKESVSETLEVENTIDSMDDVDEIFEYLIEESPFQDYFIMNHRGQGISEVEDPTKQEFIATIPNF